VIKVSLNASQFLYLSALYKLDRFKSARMRLTLQAEHREHFTQKHKFSVKISVIPTVKYYEEFKKLFHTKILGKTKEYHLILTTSVIASLPIKHTDLITQG